MSKKEVDQKSRGNSRRREPVPRNLPVLGRQERRPQMNTSNRQQLSEAELRERNHFLETVINLSPDILYIYDIVEQKNVYSNADVQRVLGYSAQEIADFESQLIPQLMHPDDFQSYIKETLHRYEIAKDNEQITSQYRMKHRDGTWRWLQSKESIYARNHDGSPSQIFGVIHDLTEQRKADERIADLALFPEEDTNPVLRVDRDMSLLYANPAAIAMVIEDGQQQGNTIPEQWHPIITEIWDANKKTDMEIVLDGKTFIFTCIPIQERGYLNVYATDITERKQAEEKLKKSENRFRSMFENHSAVMLLIEPDSGKILDSNKSANNFYGYTHQELTSMNIEDINILKSEKVKKNIDLAEATKVNIFVFKHRLKNTTLRDVQVHSTPIEYMNQTLLFSIIYDITEHKQAEEKLRESEGKFKSLICNVSFLGC